MMCIRCCHPLNYIVYLKMYFFKPVVVHFANNFSQNELTYGNTCGKLQ